MCMPLHFCAWMSVCVFVNEHGCIMSGQPLLNINNPFSISPLAFCPPPPPPTPPPPPPSSPHLSAECLACFQTAAGPDEIRLSAM